jgi:hypothetical protein
MVWVNNLGQWLSWKINATNIQTHLYNFTPSHDLAQVPRQQHVQA